MWQNREHFNVKATGNYIHLIMGFKQMQLCSLFQVSVTLASLVVVIYAQLPHYAPIPVGHHIEEYHNVGTNVNLKTLKI